MALSRGSASHRLVRAVLVTAVLLVPIRLEATIIGVAYSETNSAVVEIDEATGASALIGGAGFAGLNALAQDASGTLYSAGGTTQGDNSSLITIDPITGAGNLVATIDLGGVRPDVRSLAFSPDGVLFAAIYTGAVGSTNAPFDLFTIDAMTGIGTLVGEITSPSIQGLDFRPDGALFGWSDGTEGEGLVTIDPATGAATVVGASIRFPMQTILFGTDGSLFGAAGSNLYTIDPASGEPTLIGSGAYASLRGIECIGTCIAPVVPEPSTGVLVGLGLLSCAAARRAAARPAPRECRASPPARR